MAHSSASIGSGRLSAVFGIAQTVAAAL